MTHHICLFAGSSSGNGDQHTVMAEKIGAMIATRKMGVVYGGGRTGMMGNLAKGALDNNGYVLGVKPHFLEALEGSHKNLSDLILTDTMHERKKILYDKSAAFISLPGGFGTMEETLEVITWRQLKIHNKPIYLFNPDGYWNPMIAMFQHAAGEGFMQSQQLNLFEAVNTLDDIADILDHLKSRPSDTEKTKLI